MSKRRTYSREFKMEAFRLWQTTEKSTREVEEDLGIAHGLLYKWKRALPGTVGNDRPIGARLKRREISCRRLPPSRRVWCW